MVLVRAKTEIQRTQHLSQLPEWSSDAPAVDVRSVSGYQDGQRISIVPGHDKESFDTIAITQEMLAKKKFRIDRIDHANTPQGHPIHLASLHPWLLAATAGFHQALSGGAIGRNVEAAALHLNPVLLLTGLIVASLFTAYRFGRLSGAVLALGMAGLFPFAATFVPGAPHPLNLHALCMLLTLLTLLAGAMSASNPSATQETAQVPASGASRINYALSGIFGGLGLWLDVASTLPFLGGLVAAGILFSFFPRQFATRGLPWRIWGIAGAATIVSGYFIDFFPGRGEEPYRYLHPLYALAWLGAAELLVRVGETGDGATKWSRPRLAIAGVAALAFLQLPAVLFFSKTALFTPDGPDAFKLEPISLTAAPSLAGWLARDGFSAAAIATLAPLLVVVSLAVFVLFKVAARHRPMIGLTLGAVIPCVWLGSHQLSYWGHVDVVLLALIVVLTAALGESAKWRWVATTSALFILSLSPGLAQLFKANPADAPLATPEFESYIERDLAHWLSQHSTKPPAVLAPPRVTSGLSYYGGLAGLSTFDRENQAGASAAVRIVSASSLEEAFTLVDSRQLTHIVIPFWDTYLNTYLEMGLGSDARKERLETSFLSVLQRWELPLWVRPIPYRLPPGQGVDGPIVIFEIVEEQPPAVAAARLAEYFLEMDQTDHAREQAQNLAKYPNDWGALAAACMIATITNDAAELESARAKLFSAVERPERRRLVWDRRVSLAIVLAQQKRPDLAKAQMEKCLAEITADNLRSLTTVSLYRFNLLCKMYGFEIGDPGLRTLSRSLLRPDLRARL